jgi:hypothetical protein
LSVVFKKLVDALPNVRRRGRRHSKPDILHKGVEANAKLQVRFAHQGFTHPSFQGSVVSAAAIAKQLLPALDERLDGCAADVNTCFHLRP